MMQSRTPSLAASDPRENCPASCWPCMLYRYTCTALACRTHGCVTATAQSALLACLHALASGSHCMSNNDAGEVQHLLHANINGRIVSRQGGAMNAGLML